MHVEYYLTVKKEWIIDKCINLSDSKTSKEPDFWKTLDESIYVIF
jgi:hypothetical protein